MIANSVGTSIFVYELLYQAQARVIDEEIRLPHHWSDKTVKGMYPMRRRYMNLPHPSDHFRRYSPAGTRR